MINGTELIRMLAGENVRAQMRITEFYALPITVAGIELDLHYLSDYLVSHRFTAKKLAEESGESVARVKRMIHQFSEPVSQKLLDTIVRLVPVDHLEYVATRTHRRIERLDMGIPLHPLPIGVKIISDKVEERIY